VATHGGISPSKLHHALPWLVRFIALEPSRIYESLKYDRRIAEHKLPEDPIFVLGHWRSGTSFLQELVALDGRYATCSLFQCLFPECALSTSRWLPSLIDRIASTFDILYPIQNRALRSALPAEEEIAMLCLTDPECANWGQLFPSRMRDYVPGLRKDNRDKEWLDAYRLVVNKLSIANAGQRLVLKSPMNTARLPLLHAAYPNAVYMHIHRHPLDVFSSSRRLWQMILRQSALRGLSSACIDQQILDVYEAMMRRFLNDRRAVGKLHLVDVRYERLKADPVAILADTYESLNLGKPNRTAIERFIGETPVPAPRPRSIDQALEQQIRCSWSFAFDTWGYD
jgi:hypothetical protein